MAAPFKRKTKVLLEKDCEFAVGIRNGRVLELRPEGYLIFWDEWTDPDTGECHENSAGVISYDAIVTENNYGNLKVLRRPSAKPFDREAIRRIERSPAEVARQRFKKQYVLAIQDMLDAGELQPVRDDFCDNIVKIVARGKNRYDDATDNFIEGILGTLWDQERVTIKSLVESVQMALDAENERRERLPVPAAKLKKAGYDYILRLIKENAPLDHKIRKHGWDKAYKDLHTLGMGVETSRALQRVEIDEYTVDLFVLMQSTGLFEHMPQSIKDILRLDGFARRVTLSAAIDVHTRCFLALQIVPEGIESPLKQTVEMIYTDKNPIADAAGAKFGWPMAGAPETIVLDRGSAYVTDDAYDVLASLGITNLGAPAGKPWLKPFIERVFRTIHSDLLLRFSGRAFSNVVEREENDAADRATLTLEAFLGWLVRWTVDAYHTKKHTALGMSPDQAWGEAIKECTPRSLSSDEMREVFGVPGRRKLSQTGLRVCHIDYQSDSLMEQFVNSNAEYFEFLRWDGDIGTISARCDDGPWYTVPSKDERWIGKNDIDLREWLQQQQDEDPDEFRARRDFINDANRESFRLKQLKGLISLPKTPAELRKDVERFVRHADTAERRHKAGPYRGLLDDVDDGTGDHPKENNHVTEVAHEHVCDGGTDFDDDSME